MAYYLKGMGPLVDSIERLGEAGTRGAQRILKNKTLLLAKRSARKSPVVSSRLKNSQTVKVSGGRGEVAFNTLYADFVERGHWVKPGLLFKTKDGQWRRTKGGYYLDGQFYLKSEFDLIEPEFSKEIEEYLKGAE